MSGDHISTSEVLAFGRPAVKAGSLVLPVHVHGTFHRLRSNSSLWKKAALDVLRLLAPEMLAEHGDPEAIPARVALYETALAEVKDGKTPADAAATHGLNPDAFQRWLDYATSHGVRRAPVVPTRAPILKPSHRIL